MFSWFLAKKYIFQQKRHSILTICSIMTALALMTALFTLFSTLLSCMHDVTYDNAPYHYKITNLTKDKAESLLELSEFDCNLVIEKDYTCSVELLLKNYTEYDYASDLDNYWKNYEIDPEKQIETNRLLIMLDVKDLQARAEFAQVFAIFYVFVIFLALLLRLVIDTAFEISSKERERQFGILQSLGATPEQIVKIITCEGLYLSCIGVPLGALTGIGLGFLSFQAILSSGIAKAYLHEGQETLLHYHIDILLLIIAVITGLAWVLFSAYGTGMRVIKMTPIQAISGRSKQIQKVRKFSLFGLLFGWKGRLASRNNHRQPKRFLITVLSLTLSMVLFASVSVITDKSKIAVDRIFKELYGEFYYDIALETKSGVSVEKYLNAMKQIEASPYFANFCYGVHIVGFNEKNVIFVSYINENQYQQTFEKKPPVSYQELKDSGKYLYASSIPLEGDSLILESIFKNGEKKEISLEYAIIEKTGIPPAEAQYISKDYLKNYIWLYAPIELYLDSAKNLYDIQNYSGDFTVLLNDTKDHDKALEFLYSLDIANPEYTTDIYQMHYQADTMLSAVRIALNCLNIMFILIAVINMINIISTGIINRKSEIASLQSLGLTTGQLYGITCIECSQYALTSGILAISLTEGLLLLTAEFLKTFEVYEDDGSVLNPMNNIINYSEPIPNLLLAMAFAFVIAFLASLIPLKSMQKTPLTERMHSVD